MKKYFEIILNIIFWLITTWVISQIVGFHFSDVEIILEDGDYEQIVQGGPMKIISYSAIPPRALLFYLNVFLLIPAFFLNKKLIHYLEYLLYLKQVMDKLALEMLEIMFQEEVLVDY